jgi:hypothetical protein
MQRALCVMALGLGLAASSARPALAMSPETLLVRVPFAFSVQDEMLPAGEYQIRPLSDLDRQVLELRSTDGRHALVVPSEDGSTASRTAQPELVFHRYGQNEFLHAIQLPEGAGAVLEASRSEVEAARALASEHAVHASAARVSP